MRLVNPRRYHREDSSERQDGAAPPVSASRWPDGGIRGGLEVGVAQRDQDSGCAQRMANLPHCCVPWSSAQMAPLSPMPRCNCGHGAVSVSGRDAQTARLGERGCPALYISSQVHSAALSLRPGDVMDVAVGQSRAAQVPYRRR